jgi:hypothetical protein
VLLLDVVLARLAHGSPGASNSKRLQWTRARYMRSAAPSRQAWVLVAGGRPVCHRIAPPILASLSVSGTAAIDRMPPNHFPI